MKKVIFIIIVIVILGGLGYYFVNNKDNNETNNSNTTVKKETFDEVAEKEKLGKEIKNIQKNLGFLAVLTSIDKYNADGSYTTKKNVNLLESQSFKQLFVMEQIVSNKENYKNFVILDMNGDVSKEKILPTEDGTTAYYPSSLFEKEYEKYFDEEFKIEERVKSNLNNSYDENAAYVYYENRRAGSNGLYVDSININKIEQASSSNIAEVTMNYSSRLSEILKVESEKAELTYIWKDDGLNIISFVIK